MTSYVETPRGLRSRAPSTLTLKVEALLKRYPNLSEDGLADLIEMLPFVPVLDTALMAADDELSRRFEAFHRDHRHKLQPALPTLAATLLFPAMFLIWLLLWFFA